MLIRSMWEPSCTRNCTAEVNAGWQRNKDCVRALVLEHTCDGNDNGRDGAGIHSTSSSNRIDGNNVTDNERGIDVDTKGSLSSKTNASGNIPWCTGGGPPTQ